MTVGSVASVLLSINGLFLSFSFFIIFWFHRRELMGLPESTRFFISFLFPKKKWGWRKQFWQYEEEKEVQTSIRDQKGWAAFIKEVSRELMLFPAQAVLSWSGSKRG